MLYYLVYCHAGLEEETGELYSKLGKVSRVVLVVYFREPSGLLSSTFR